MKALGRNQIIGCSFGGAGVAIGAALCFAGKVEGGSYLDFLQLFIPAILAIILGGAAVVKRGQVPATPEA